MKELVENGRLKRAEHGNVQTPLQSVRGECPQDH